MKWQKNWNLVGRLVVDMCVNCTSAFDDDLTFVLPSSRLKKGSLCSSIHHGRLHVLLSINLHCVRYSYAWDSSVRSWKFSLSLYRSGVRERRVGSMGLNMDISPLVEEYDTLVYHPLYLLSFPAQTDTRGAIAHVSKNPRVSEARCEHELFSSLSGSGFFVSPSLIKMMSSGFDPRIRDLRTYGNIW